MTISSTNRKAGPYIGNGTASTFPFSFKVFQASDLEVVKLTVATNIETTLALTTDYTVTLNADQNSNAGGSITLVAGALASGYNLVITSDIANLQPTDLTNQGGFYPEVITTALDRATIQIQQLQEGLDRAALLPITSSADAASLVADIERLALSADNIDTVANSIGDVNTVADNVGIVNTVASNISNINTVAGISSNVTTVAGNSTNINNVAGNTTNINTVAGNNSNISTVAGISSDVTSVAGNLTNINTVATNIASVNSAATNMAAIIDAPTQAASAAASAASAAASAASGMYSSVQDKSANYTVVSGDAGDLLRITTTSGSITITLPLISTVTDGFKIAIVKWTGDTNAVNIARSGSDTINGATSATIGSQYSQVMLVADFETGQWFASTSGLGTTNVVVDAFNGTGSQTAFTLSGDPATENNTYVYVGGVYQNKSTYSLSGTVLTFSVAPPTGTGNIEVVWLQPLAVGTPSDGTVTTTKIVDANVTDAKLSTSGVTAGTYGSSTAIAQITVNNKGRITSASEIAVGGTPSGAVMPFAGSSAPSGWLLCYGQAVSRTTYAALFAIVSTTYGAGDGSTTFNLPDLRGRSAFGVDNMGGTAANRVTSGGSGITGTTLGASGGTETHTLTTAQMPSHTHTTTASASSAGAISGSCPSNVVVYGAGTATSSVGGGGAHQNMSPAIMLNYIIKT
jgi:microcystin-dependent protein